MLARSGRLVFNSALIQLLKQEFAPEINTMEETNIEIDKLKTILGSDIFNNLPKVVIQSLIEQKKDCQKLMAVKILKNNTGMSLIAAKSFMDSWF